MRRAARRGGKVTWAEVDVSERVAGCARMIAKAVDVFGKLDVKFNNAGINKPMNFLDVTEENWRSIMEVNGLGVLIGMQEAAKQMMSRAEAARSSTRRRSPVARDLITLAPYCASKWAVVSLTQSGARDLAKAQNINCNGFLALEWWPRKCGASSTRDLNGNRRFRAWKGRRSRSFFSADILRGRVATPARYHPATNDVSGVEG